MGLTLSDAVRTCRACHKVEACKRWYGDGLPHGAPAFCPNADVLDAYATRKLA